LKDAQYFGFYVDKNNPWRMIANLESEQMRSAILRYGPTENPDHILTRIFRRKTQYEDISSVFVFFQKLGISLTLEELLMYTVVIRIAETGIDPSMMNEIYEKAYRIYDIYSSNYPQDPFKGSSAIIAEYCSAKLKQLHTSRANIDSYEPTTFRELN
jgi:hypothetical protein